MSARTAIAAAVAAVLLLGAGTAGWTLQSWRADAQIATLVAQHAQVMQSYADAAYAASERARAIEQRRTQEQEEIRHEAQQRELALAGDLAAVRGELDRLRRHYAATTASHRTVANDPAATARSEAASDAIGMFAHLLGRLGDAAAIYAYTADRSRIAGLACERAYDSLREGDDADR